VSGVDPAEALPEHRAVSRGYAYALSAALLAAMLWPALLDPQDPANDSFPLSTYPMFSYDKPRTATVTSAVAQGPGFEEPLAPSFVGTSETMQALRTIQRAVRAGRTHARQLCETMAERVARSADPQLARAERVALVTQTVDSIHFLAGDRKPLRRKIELRCPVRRKP
jgi:hypothetical protein